MARTRRPPRENACRDSDGTLRLAADHYGVVAETPVRLMFAEADGRLVCVRVEIGPSFDDAEQPDPVRVTTGVLRAIPLTTLTDEMLVNLAEQAHHLASSASDPGRPPQHAEQLKRAAAEWQSLTESTPAANRPGRPREYDEEHFREVAKVHNANSGGRSPTRAVQRHFEKKLGRSVSKSTAAKWVARCRAMDPPLIAPYGERDSG